MTKIYELAEKAAEHAVLNYSGEVLQSETEDVRIQIPKEFIDKFAELILKEAAGLFPLVFTDEQYQRRVDKTLLNHFDFGEDNA